MDLSVNRSVKEYLRTKFRVWYSEQVQQKLAKNDFSILTLTLIYNKLKT